MIKRAGLTLKIILGLFLIVFLSWVVIYTLAVTQGRRMLIRQLGLLTGRKVQIDKLSIDPLFKIRISDMEIEGVLKAKEIYLVPNLWGIWQRRLVLSKATITGLHFEWALQGEKKSPSPGASLAEAASYSPVGGSDQTKQDVSLMRKSGFSLPVAIRYFLLRNSTVKITDYNIKSDGLVFVLQDIFLEVTDLDMATSVITRFNLSANIPWKGRQKSGTVNLEGWLNFKRKDIQAKLNIEGIDGIYLYPYYAKWVDLEKARIKDAVLNFTSDIQGLNNDVVARCRLELVDIVRIPTPPDQTKNKAELITDAVLALFNTINKGRIALEFTHRTKFDQPRFLGFENIRLAFEDKLKESRKKTVPLDPKDVAKFPWKIMEGMFKGATDLTTSVITGTISAGKEIGKSVEGVFRAGKSQKGEESLGNLSAQTNSNTSFASEESQPPLN